MQDIDSREESPMLMGPTLGTLGTLTLLGKKTGAVVGTFPIDAERITFGREQNCDVRLYYADISKLHAEITFDLESGQATLHVRGSNGLHHHPEGSRSASYKPPATIALSHNDVISIRKKQFRFQYGATETPLDAGVLSPAPARASPSPYPKATATIAPLSPGMQMVRRRASHRLSLVPSDREFQPILLSPATNRRHSTLGLGSMSVGTGAGKSKLNEVHQDEEEDGEEEVESGVLNAVEGDDGDMVYLESTELVEEETGEHKANHTNPFMSPQKTRSAPLCNTSTISPTPQLSVSLPPTPTQPPTELPPVPAALPETCTTPPPPSPQRVPPRTPTTPVPAHVAMATPKGPATLRKALLLRSARKVWAETRAVGIEGAVQDGHVEITRRKSTSPKDAQRRKSATPPAQSTPIKDLDLAEHHSQRAEMAEDVGLDDGAQQNDEEGELQWVYEDGQAEVSFESDSSGRESLEADVSMDIPGQGILHLENMQIDEGEEAQAEEQGDGWVMLAERYEECEEEMVVYDEQEQEQEQEADVANEDMEGEDEDEDEDVAMSLPGTPRARAPLTSKFFTPQPQRHYTAVQNASYTQPRRSLVDIAGPPVRYDHAPSTPRSIRGGRIAPTPGSLGKPSRRLTVPIPSAKEEAVVVERRIPVATPRKTAAQIAEAQRRNEALATPRILPAPPASGFKDPVRETRFADLVSTPSHPALAPRTPEPQQPGEREPEPRLAVPSTPMDDIKKRLDSMRRQSVQRQATYPAGRRATVGFALPGTPGQRPEMVQSASYSVAPARRMMGQAPRTPIFPKMERAVVREHDEVACASPAAEGMDVDASEEEGEENMTPTPHSAALDQPASAPSQAQQPSSPSTPSFAGLRQMLHQPLPARTPNLVGIRGMFPATPVQESGSPSLVGVKTMLYDPKAVETPRYAGMKEMFRERKEERGGTPGMDGVREMYEDEEAEAEEELIEEVGGKVKGKGKAVAAKQDSKLPRLSGSSGSRATRAPAASHADEKEAAPEPTTRPTSRLPARRTAVPAPPEIKSKPSRARKVNPVEAPAAIEPVPEPASRASRTRREPSAEPTRTSSRSTRARSTAESDEKSVLEEPTVHAPVPAKSTRAVSASSRTTRKAASVEVEDKVAVAEAEEKKSKSSRGKKVLLQIDEQPVVEAAEESKSAPARGKRATATSSGVSASSSSTARRPVSAPTRSTAATSAVSDLATEKVSVPTRRKGKATDKENDESLVKGEEEKPPVKKRATGGPSGVPVPSVRVTRSRK